MSSSTTKKYSFIVYAFIGLLNIAIEVALAESDCVAPAKSLVAQANDFCFTLFSTDDIAHPGVVSCVSTFSALSDSCANRTNLKTLRCNLLLERNLLAEGVSVDKCVRSTKTEGFFVLGCEYPFTEECVSKANQAISK